MSETLALIISGVSIVGGIAGVFFFQGKSKKEIIDKNNKILELEKTILELSSSEIKNNQIEQDSLQKINKLEEENKNILSLLNSSKAELCVVKEKDLVNLANLANGEKRIEELQNRIFELEVNLKEQQDNQHCSNINNAVEAESRKTILFVDDSPVIRVSMKKLLANSNYDLTLANDGVHALTILETQKFDLIITDLEMPNLDGFGLISKLSENPEIKNIPVMVVTGHEDLEVKVSKLSNLYGISKKPWDEACLLNRIKFLSSLKK